MLSCLSLAEEVHAVVAAPSSTDGGAEAGRTGTLVAETTGLATRGVDTTGFTVLVDGVDNPVVAGVVADGGVLRIGADDFVPGEDGISVGPVGVEDTEVAEAGTRRCSATVLWFLLSFKPVIPEVLGLP